jgi:threonine dehydratase
VPTPLERGAEELAPGRELYLKREDAHELGAFKWRGALPVVRSYRDRGARGVVTASTGNHGAATAWAARELGMRAVVFAPEAASRPKVELIESLGAELRLAGSDLDAAKEEALAYARSEDVPFFEDGAEPAQYAAYEEIGEEVLDALAEPPAAVVVPVGNGALMIGVARALARRAPATLRVAAVAREAPVMAESIAAGRAAPGERCATFADGIAVRVAIPGAVEALAPLVSEVVLVSEREIAESVGAYARAGIRAEGAAASALAALWTLGPLEGAAVAIVTGRNIEDELHARAVERPESFPA